MEFQKLIESRKSIRKYDGSKGVSKAQVEEILKAAQLAPSWKNQQATRYYVVLSEEKRAEFREKCLPEFNAKNCQDAGAIVVVAYEKNIVGYAPDHVTPTNELGNGWGIYDAGLQSEHLLLKAKELGLGTLIMGIRDAKQIKDFLAIPENVEIISVISLGYPAQDPDARPRKALEEIAAFV